MKASKIYTRTGDKGSTGLSDGTRISKDNIRIESYGTIDELNSFIALCYEELHSFKENELKNMICNWFIAIQHDLFNIGSDLATPVAARWKDMVIISQNEIDTLEQMIDFLQSQLKPLAKFILPGGSYLNCYLHLARTVCRRAERHIVTLSHQEEVNEFVIKYINRLSDLIFVLSRIALKIDNKKEIEWNKKGGIGFLDVKKTNSK